MGIREERTRGIRIGGLGLNGGNGQRSFSHTVYQQQRTQDQGKEGEDGLGPGDGEDGEGQGQDGQEEIASGGPLHFAALDIPPQVAHGVDRRARGQGPYKDGAAGAGEEEQGEAKDDIEQCDPDRGCPGPEKLTVS